MTARNMRPANPAFRRGAGVALALAAVWALFNWGDISSWIVGVIFIVLGTLLALWLPAGDSRALRPAAILRFAVFFVLESVRGGLQVARRALAPGFSARPGFIRHRPDLSCQAAHTLFKDALTLTPGTIFVDKDGDLLIIHCMDLAEQAGEDIADLERRVGRIFGGRSPTGAA